MNRKSIIYIVVVLVLFVLLVFMEGNKKKPLDWRQTYSGKDKIPYGTYVFKNLLKDLYPENTLTENSDGIYMFLKMFPYPDKCKFVYITHNFYLNDELEKLLEILKKGNDVFIAAELFDNELEDTLDFRTEYRFTSILDSNKMTSIHFVNNKIDKAVGYRVNEAFTGCYFEIDDSTKQDIQVLAVDEKNYPILIKVHYEKGDLYLCSTPQLFCNYNVLYGNTEYPFTVLSHLRGSRFIWDEYYKPYKTEVSSPLRYILTQPALKAAYIILAITILLYIYYQGKRRQRAVPVIAPPQNRSVEFISTVGMLYFNSGSNKDIAMKKYFHFCDYIRNKYHVKSISIEPEFYKLLAEHSGIAVDAIAVLFKLANHIQNQEWTSDEVLLSFNEKIEDFYKKTK